MRLKPADFLIAAISVAAIIFSIGFVNRSMSGTPVLVIESPEGKFVYPMNKNKTVTIHGRLGDSTIQIKNGRARFLDSPCPNKLCVKMGDISKDSEWAACLPNQIFIRIENKKGKAKIDASTF